MTAIVLAVSLLLSGPSLLAVADGSGSVDTALLHLVLALLVTAVAAQVVRAVVRGYAEQGVPAEPVEAGEDGRPRRVGRLRVGAIREEWLVEDGWWTAKPLQRSYFEVVLEDGSDVVVFSEPRVDDGPTWFRQRD